MKTEKKNDLPVGLPWSRAVRLAGGRLGGGERLFLIAGPCVVEDRDTMFRTAEALAELSGRLGVLLVFKASYIKANRSAGASPRGPALDADPGVPFPSERID